MGELSAEDLKYRKALKEDTDYMVDEAQKAYDELFLQDVPIGGKADFKYTKLAEAPERHLIIAEKHAAGADPADIAAFFQYTKQTVLEIIRHPPIVMYIEYLKADLRLQLLEDFDTLKKKLEKGLMKCADVMLDKLEEGKVSGKDVVDFAKFFANHNPDKTFAAGRRDEVVVKHGMSEDVFNAIASDATRLKLKYDDVGKQTRLHIDCDQLEILDVKSLEANDADDPYAEDEEPGDSGASPSEDHAAGLHDGEGFDSEAIEDVEIVQGLPGDGDR